VAAVLLAMLATAPAAGAADFTLRKNDAVHWAGPTVAPGTNPADPCAAPAQCPRYTFDVRSGTSDTGQLRVAIHWPDKANVFELDLYDPDGQLAGKAAGDDGIGFTTYDLELFAPRPKLGVWTVRVVEKSGSPSAFKGRAKLENRAAPVASGPLLPDLRITPPLDFTFAAPTSPEPDLVSGPQAAVNGTPVLSCTADETAEYHSTRCLRFTSGVENAGAGALELRMDVSAATPQPDPVFPVKGPLYQRIYDSSHQFTERPAGSWVFHAVHSHFHYQDLAKYTLFKVTDPAVGTMVPAGIGQKAGFCVLDERMVDFDTSFAQVPRHYDATGCITPHETDPDQTSPSQAFMGLSAHWGDVYTWQRTGQYVDFGANGDGLYVVRAVANSTGMLEESDTTDNSGYAYVRIQGDSVTLLERGRGSDPWDPFKVVVDGL
jgi:hypothetical protein